jgi:hypothetical protein
MEQNVFNKLSGDCAAFCSHFLHFKSPWEVLRLVEQKVFNAFSTEGMPINAELLIQSTTNQAHDIKLDINCERQHIPFLQQ